MKKYTHAWLALKAVELLHNYSGQFSTDRNEHLDELLNFMSQYPTTFVRGAWFPDTIIKDNVQGGHTWKYTLDAENGREVFYRPPSHNSCLGFVQDDLENKVQLIARTSDLPDRCEALSQTIRDTIRITNKVRSGDIVAFNNSQIATFFLMLAHYVCDAHVPVHCDDRDLYHPSKVHPDLEKFWEYQIKKYYKVSTKTQQFDLDENQNLQLNSSSRGYKDSILYECDEELKRSQWGDIRKEKPDWQAFLGKGNKNLWDYLVSVCLVSFHMSLKMFPTPPPNGTDYDLVKIMKVSPFKENVVKYSPFILADAINSVALVWLATWERWELLKKGIRVADSD
jgi:hypothetical protein